MNRSLFRMSDESSLSVLTLRQRKLVEGAVTYNALIQPGRTLAYKVYLGGNWLYPCLTDISTLDGSLTAKAGLEPVCEFSATSLIDGQSETTFQWLTRVFDTSLLLQMKNTMTI